MLSLIVIVQSGSVQTASDSSPNRIRLQSKPHPTAVQTASDSSPIYGRLAEGLEIPHVKTLCFKTLFPTTLFWNELAQIATNSIHKLQQILFETNWHELQLIQSTNYN